MWGAGAAAAVLYPRACTAEFEAATTSFRGIRSQLVTLTDAQRYLAAHHALYELVTAQRCESSPPREVDHCTGEPILVVLTPVANPVCRYHRDDGIRTQLGFNAKEQLVRTRADMWPYHILKSQFLGLAFDWGR